MEDATALAEETKEVDTKETHSLEEALSGEYEKPVKAPTSPPTSAEPSEKEEPQKGDEKKEVEPDRNEDAGEKKGEEEKAEEVESPQVDWDSEKNPYKKRHKDAGDYANRVNQKNIQLERQIDERLNIINKKLDGDYDPEKDGQVDIPDTASIEAEAELAGKLTASRLAAIDKHSEEFVNKTVLDEDSEYRKIQAENPSVGQRVISAESPILEAIKVVEEINFFKEHGTDTKKIEARFYEKFKTTEIPKLKEEITKEIMDNINGQKQLTNGVRSARGVETKPDFKGEEDMSLDGIFKQE